ncbi:MAG: DNA-deoxyinosine glycosylase [Nitrospirota bacterium]
MPHIHCFAPIEDSRSTVLVLGSMPGRASLQAGQYYAHPRNSFWQVMGDLVGAGMALPYESRVYRLKSYRIALWDVLKSCTRKSSLDSDIDESSITPNDFISFYQAHPGVAHVFFNGAKAEACYRKYVLASLSDKFKSLPCQRLPSTSPANASLSYKQKLKAWRIVVQL